MGPRTRAEAPLVPARDGRPPCAWPLTPCALGNQDLTTEGRLEQDAAAMTDEARRQAAEAQERKEHEKTRLEEAKDAADRKARQDAAAKAQKAKKPSGSSRSWGRSARI